MKKILAVFLLVSGGAAAVSAQVTGAQTINFTVSSLPEAKLEYVQSWTIPMLRGEGFLTSGNNLRIALPLAVTPVSVSLGADFALTPVAFAQIRAGGSAASGWNVPGLAPASFGMNEPLADSNGDGFREGRIAGEPFEAAVWKVYGGVVLQFDIGAVTGGDWAHVQFQTYQQFYYRANTKAGDGQPWGFENDGGENRNGFKYYSSYTLAYQLPELSPVLRTLALQAELEWRLYNTPGGEAWGEDLPACTFSAAANFEVTRWFSFALIAQLTYDRNYSNWQRRVDGSGEVYYQDRALVTRDGNKMNLNFHRFAGIFTFRL